MKLTETDKKILESYKSLVDGLAEYLGTSCEIVLHSLEDFDYSIIKIVNGEHTGRKVGAPITSIALDFLKQMNEKEDKSSVAYFAKNKKGEPLKSITIAVRGEKNRIIGLLCINYYLNTPVINFLQTFTYVEKLDSSSAKEIFSENTTDIIEEAIQNAKDSVYNDETILPSLKNKKIIQILLEQGIFNIKNSAEYVAEKLGVSKNTVYLHIRNSKN